MTRPGGTQVFEHVVVASDGSERALAGFAFAVDLVRRGGGRVTLVSVLEPGGVKLEEERRAEQRELAAELDSLAATAPEGVEVESRVLDGKAAPALIDLLAELSPDLVVAGTRGVGLSRFVLGSVSHRLLENAPCSVLLIPWSEPPAGSLSVIAALDGSAGARRGLEAAERLAAALAAPLVLTHVADYSLPSAYPAYESVRDLIHERGLEVIAEGRDRVESQAGEVVEDLREGNPRRQLIDAAREREPAIVAVGSRGAGGFQGLLLGSTARDLVNHAGCPVLVVRGADQSTDAA